MRIITEYNEKTEKSAAYAEKWKKTNNNIQKK